MLYSVTCIVPNEWDNILFKIFSALFFLNYNWYVADAEAYIKEGTEYVPLLANKLYSTDQINNQANQYSYIINCLIYGSSSCINNYFIENIQDFQNSRMELAVIITDSVYLEIYLKNEKIAEKIYHDFKKYGWENIELKIGEFNRKIFLLN